MPLPRPVPPPVIRTRLLARRSVRNMRFLRRKRNGRLYERGLPDRWGTRFPREFAFLVAARCVNCIKKAFHRRDRRGRPQGSLRKAFRFLLAIAGYSESVVGVLEFWRDAGAGRAAGYFNVVSPGASARGFAGWLHRALLGTLRVAFWRDRIVIRVVPIAAPFVQVVADVIQAERVRSVLRDSFWSGLPAGRVVWEGLRRIVSPGKLFLLEASAGGAFPFRFGGQTEG